MHRVSEERPRVSPLDAQQTRFVAFFTATHPIIRDAAYARVKDWQQAEDIAEEVFLAAWRHREEEAVTFTAEWAFGALRNIVGNEYRRRDRSARRVARLTAEHQPAPDHLPADDALVVRAAVAQLAEADQRLLRMAYWQDLPREQMAAELGCSVGAVKTRLSRALRALRAKLRLQGRER